MNFELFNKGNHEIEHSFNVFIGFVGKRCVFGGAAHAFSKELTDFIGVVVGIAVPKEHTHDFKEVVSGNFVKDDENNFVGGFCELIFVFEPRQTDIDEEEHGQSEEVSQVRSNVTLFKLSQCASQPRQVIVHVNRLQTLIQKSQHD